MSSIRRRRVFSLSLCVSLVAGAALLSHAQTEGDAWAKKKSAWLQLTPSDRGQVMTFADDYKNYLAVSRTAETSTREITKRALAAGFVEFTNPAQVKAGAHLIVTNRDRALILVIVGSDPIVNGTHVVGTHHDSPHIDLKGRPIYSVGEVALFKTIFYGGIKTYQWANVPLAVVGRIDTADGRTIDVSIGLHAGDPVFVIPDNAPHSDKELRSRTYTEVLKAEELDPVAGSIPGEKSSVASEVAKTLMSTYKIAEEDLVGAELALVPAASPADVGLDRGLVGAYGQDDRLSSFCAARSIIDLKGTPKVTAMAYLSNFEETGSVNNTGAGSEFLNSTYARLVGAERGSGYSDLDLRRALHNAEVISADANDGINPIFPGNSEASNASRVGYGVSIKLYGGGFDAPSEFTAKLRGLMDRNGIPWQTQTPRVGVGGGGTIGGFMSREDMEVIDLGVPLLSMHSPFEMSSKVDVWEFYRTMTAFYLQ